MADLVSGLGLPIQGAFSTKARSVAGTLSVCLEDYCQNAVCVDTVPPISSLPYQHLLGIRLTCLTTDTESHSLEHFIAVNASEPNCPDNASRSVFARPLTRSFSFLVILYDGHITPGSIFLQAPLLLHISTAP